MKYVVSIILFCFYFTGITAQEKHFVFIQADNNQPFYVSLNGKLYSSTASGYVILSKLVAGEYNFSVGFAQNAYPEQSFQVIIENKDLGFNLKNFGEKGWGLFNLQTLNVTMTDSTIANAVIKPVIENTAPKDDDEPLINFTKKKKTVKTNRSADTLATQAAAVEKPKDREVKSGISGLADVKKISETKDEEGMHLSFAENNGSGTDTILISIPLVKSSDNESDRSSAEKNNADSNTVMSSEPVAAAGSNTTKDSVKFLDIDMNNVAKDSATKSDSGKETVSASTNSKCTNIATDDDFVRLRRRMAMETTDEKMINQAKKMYRNKCFTTSQIKKLSTLFLSDEGRYNFFNVSYSFVADTSGYSALQSEFVDPAYVNRFKAMLQ